MTTTVSPFARASVFDEPRLGGREQTVSDLHVFFARAAMLEFERC